MRNKRITLKEIEKATAMADGSFTSHYFYRPISRKITFLLAKTKIIPEQVCIFALFIGLVGAIFFLYHTYLSILLGSFIFFFRHILDCVDGEIARLKNQCTKSGALLDIFIDRFVDVIMFSSLGLGLWMVHKQTWIWILTFFAMEGQFFMGAILLKIESLKKELNIKIIPIKNKRIFRRVVQYGDDTALMILILSALFNKILYGLFIIALLSNIFALVLFFYYYKKFRRIEKNRLKLDSCNK